MGKSTGKLVWRLQCSDSAPVQHDEEIYQSIFVPTLAYGHELRVVIEKQDCLFIFCFNLITLARALVVDSLLCKLLVFLLIGTSILDSFPFTLPTFICIQSFDP